MDFLEKLKAMMMGQSADPSAITKGPAMQGGSPWEDPSLGGPRPMPSAAPVAPEAPMSPQDDIERQVMMLQKQRDIAKRMLPEQSWNR